MAVLRRVKRMVPQRVRREYAIRFRLLRSSLRSIRAERDADALLISYPKCGRTWLRVLLSRALAARFGVEDVDYLSTDLLNRAVPEAPHIRITHDDNPHWKSPRRLARSKRRYRNKKVILLVRDPRDVVVSMYFERSRREQAYTGTMQQFLREPRGSLETIIAYYNVWAAERTTPRDFHLVRYEDLIADTAGELRRILRFVGLDDFTAEELEAAVAFASFRNMRAMELGGKLNSGRLRPRDPGDVESFKTRRGKVGGYVDYLSPEAIDWVEQRIRCSLDPFYGYREPPAAAADGGGPAATRPRAPDGVPA